MTKHNNPSDKNPDYAQMAHDLNDKILQISNEITDQYPELLKYLDEMPITIPSDNDPEMSLKQLQSHYESLASILSEYKAKQPKKGE
ncbi:hypothetical protein [Geofilum rubicundum]|uniref:Uncharacterized protein n=1 Tax=Geofilum rubicundum JCM 15548 TaxID=1236989 RepID=A0A0E9LQW7_9BACT|nr:hypothetical protein [Geofilum rubicundum]GAO27693.1 hypothetical protein JCM15548_14538 [Geofilum rubicundum JCM 15548]